MQNPNPQVIYNEQPKKSNTPLIIGIVVAVLLCCCCIVVLGGAAIMSQSVNKVFSSINQQLTAMPAIPSSSDATMEPSSSDATQEPSSPEATIDPLNPTIPEIPADTIPQGGRGDQLQRAQAWAQSLSITIISGCTPVAKDTKIEVTQEPDSSGMWMEKWTIACDGGTNVPVDITFTPSGNGITDIKVSAAK